MIPDLINGSFEMVGTCAVWSNVAAITRDREVKGIDWRVTLFFTAWGAWNLFYYPYLGQWFSLLGGVFIMVANVVWIGLVLYYKNRPSENSYELAARWLNDDRDWMVDDIDSTGTL